MASQTFTTVGQTFTQDVANNKYTEKYYHTLRLSATLNSINQDELTANATLKCILISRYLAWSNDEIIFSVGINGETKALKAEKSGGDKNKASVSNTYVTWTGDIPYNSDGTLTATLTASSRDNNGVYSPPNQTAEIVATFPFIPRESSIKSISGEYLGSAVTVVLDRKVDDYVHKVEYSFAGSEWETATSTGGTSVSFTPALELASNIPTLTSGYLSVRVTTLNGTTQIGDVVKDAIALKLPDSVVPSFTSVTASPSSYIVPSNWELYVRSLSSAIIKINGDKGVYGSTITSYSISGGGFSGNDATLETDILNNKGSITFTATITDSRGRTATKTVEIEVVDYFKPSISVNANRCDEKGNLVSNGTYLKVTANYSYASVSSKNTVSVSVDCNGVYDTSFTSGKAFILDCNVIATQGYILTASINDALGGYNTVTFKIDSDSTLFVVSEKKDSIVWGSYELEEDKFKVDMPMKITKTLDMAGNKIINAIIEGYSGDGTGGNGIVAPVNGFFYMNVDADGNLWAYSADDGTTPPFEYDSATGDLYVVLEVE